MSSDRSDGYLYSKLRRSRGVHPYPVQEVWQLHRLAVLVLCSLFSSTCNDKNGKTCHDMIVEAIMIMVEEVAPNAPSFTFMACPAAAVKQTRRDCL